MQGRLPPQPGLLGLGQRLREQALQQAQTLPGTWPPAQPTPIPPATWPPQPPQPIGPYRPFSGGPNNIAPQLPTPVLNEHAVMQLLLRGLAR